MDKTWNQLFKIWFKNCTSRSFMILVISMTLACLKVIDVGLFAAINGYNYLGPAIKDKLTNGTVKPKGKGK